jgi:hypothetical protein
MTLYDAVWLAGIVIVGGGILAALCVQKLRGVPGYLIRGLFLAIGAYLLYGAIGIALAIYFSPAISHTPAATRGLVITMIGWLGLAVSILFYLLPKELWREDRPKPQWMQRFGIFDFVCLVAVIDGIRQLTGH